MAKLKYYLSFFEPPLPSSFFGTTCSFPLNSPYPEGRLVGSEGLGGGFGVVLGVGLSSGLFIRFLLEVLCLKIKI